MSSAVLHFLIYSDYSIIPIRDNSFCGQSWNQERFFKHWLEIFSIFFFFLHWFHTVWNLSFSSIKPCLVWVQTVQKPWVTLHCSSQMCWPHNELSQLRNKCDVIFRLHLSATNESNEEEYNRFKQRAWDKVNHFHITFISLVHVTIKAKFKYLGAN